MEKMKQPFREDMESVRIMFGRNTTTRLENSTAKGLRMGESLVIIALHSHREA